MPRLDGDAPAPGLMDALAMAAAVKAAMREAIDEALAPVLARLDALERRETVVQVAPPPAAQVVIQPAPANPPAVVNMTVPEAPPAQVVFAPRGPRDIEVTERDETGRVKRARIT